MKYIPELTLICVDCFSYGKAVSAMQKSLEQIRPARAIFLTDIPIQVEGFETVIIPPIKSKAEYSYFMVKELYKHFDTSHCLVIQHDGYVLDGNQWDDKFLEYDYIGSAWLYTDGRNVGNGGFSIRSHRLQKYIGIDGAITITHHEDDAICRLYRPYLEHTYDIKFAPEGVADRFAFELREPKCPTFGFHGNFHPPYRPTVVFKRSGALGDIVIAEPVFRHFANMGYNIVLDVPREMYALFENHYFPIKHIDQFDSGRITPEKRFDLDMSYETKPIQSYLKSYFEFCGVKDYQLSRPQLYPLSNDTVKPFKKYCVIHIDNRPTLHRNIYGVDWGKVRRFLETNGYVVIQVGKGEHNVAGIEMNTPHPGTLKWIISGCDLFIGVDSAPAGIAVAYNKPCVLMFGSVNPDYIHPDLRGVEIVQGKCEKSFCWHTKKGGTEGVECAFKASTQYLQCCKSDYDTIIDAIKKLTPNETI